MKIDDAQQSVKELMTQNQMRWDGYRYTRPAPTTYEQQWLWDSCFHAVINIHLDPTMAKDELKSLLYHRGVELDGMIPHMVYWNGGGDELWGKEYVSAITQPPLLARAALEIHEKTWDDSFLNEIYEPLHRYYDWLFRTRDADKDYLISIVHPWESGWDASQRWDQILGFSDPSPEDLRRRRFELAKGLKEHNAIASMRPWKDFNVEPVDFNALFSDSLAALAIIAKRIGKEEDSRHYAELSFKVNRAISTKMWDEQEGYYWDLSGEEETPIKVPSSASFITLFAGVPSEKQAIRLVEQLYQYFWTEYPVPTVSVNYPTFSPAEYWRGNTWLNLNWLIIRGLARYGFWKTANDLITKSTRLTQEFGFWEFYNPISGEGRGSYPHSWSGIIIDLLNRPNFVDTEQDRN